jgi:hypothetical protein
MEQHIIEPNEDFDFSKCTLLNPIAMQGSSYFTRVQYNGSNLYIQTPKCLSKQGIVKQNKKMYIELMFDNSHEIFISWLEHLENTFQNLIYDKNDDWFQNPLEKTDIESSFVSPIKVYKSGKNYLVRVPIKVNAHSLTPLIKIYNENTDELCVEDIKEDSHVICIIEILGIRFTSRNFQIDMEVKQMMTLIPDKFLHNCLIKKKELSKHTEAKVETNTFELESLDIKEEDQCNQGNQDLDQEKLVIKTEPESVLPPPPPPPPLLKPDPDPQEPIEFLFDHDELKEVDIMNESSQTLETFTIKKPNEVFYEIYKKAKEKAKLAKREALRAVLEAKNIKKTYMLDDDSDEDDDIISDFDEEEWVGGDLP